MIGTLNQLIKRYQTGGLILLSAGAHLVPIFFPSWWWLSLTALVPLLYAVMSIPVAHLRWSWWYGFLWGAVVYAVHMSAFLAIIAERMGIVSACGAAIVIIAYMAMYAAIWVGGMAHLVHAFHSVMMKIMVMSAMSLLYFWFMYEGVLCVLGVWYGYCFIHPLLALVAAPRLLGLVSSLGLWPATGIVVGGQAVMAVGLRYVPAWVLGTWLLLLGTFGTMFDFSVPPPSAHTVNAESIVWIKPASVHNGNRWESLLSIVRQVATVTQQFPRVQLIIFPETTFPFPLANHANSTDMLYENCRHSTVHIVLGAHRQEEEKLYNCAYCFYQGRIIYHYDKQHLMPITEYQCLSNKLFSRLLTLLYPQQETLFTPGSAAAQICPYQTPFFVQICSDLFLGHVGTILSAAQRRAVPIICIANDSWFKLRYLPRLMRDYAIFIALVHRLTLIYVSHEYGLMVSADGVRYQLNTIS